MEFAEEALQALNVIRHEAVGEEVATGAVIQEFPHKRIVFRQLAPDFPDVVIYNETDAEEDFEGDQWPLRYLNTAFINDEDLDTCRLLVLAYSLIEQARLRLGVLSEALAVPSEGGNENQEGSNDGEDFQDADECFD